MGFANANFHKQHWSQKWTVEIRQISNDSCHAVPVFSVCGWHRGAQNLGNMWSLNKIGANFLSLRSLWISSKAAEIRKASKIYLKHDTQTEGGFTLGGFGGGGVVFSGLFFCLEMFSNFSDIFNQYIIKISNSSLKATLGECNAVGLHFFIFNTATLINQF